MQEIVVHYIDCRQCGLPAQCIVIIEGIEVGEFCEFCAEKMRDEIEEDNQRQRDEGLLPEWW